MRGEPAQDETSGEVVLRLTHAELLLLAGSVNEAIEAVEGWEFPARLGATREDAIAMRNQLGDLIARMPPR